MELAFFALLGATAFWLLSAIKLITLFHKLIIAADAYNQVVFIICKENHFALLLLVVVMLINNLLLVVVILIKNMLLVAVKFINNLLF